MMYVDEDLCTGCGVCLDVCPQEAVSLGETQAIIEAARCTSCGRCADVCAAGAIIDVEIIDRQPFLPTISGAAFEPAAPVRIAAPSLASSLPSLDVGIPPQPSAGSRLERPSTLQVADKVLSGLLNVLAFALDRGRGRQSNSVLKGALINRRSPASGGSDVGDPRRGSSRCGGRGQKRGQGLGGRRGRREQRRCRR